MLLLHQSEEGSRTLNDKMTLGWVSSELGIMAQLQQKYEDANQYQLSALSLLREVGYQFMVATVLVRLGNLALLQGDSRLAHLYYVESLAICQQLDDKVDLISALEGLAGVVALCGRPTEVAHWLGAAKKHRQAIGLARSIDERSIYERTVAIIRTALGDTRFEAAIIKGHTIALNDVVTEALGTPNDPHGP